MDVFPHALCLNHDIQDDRIKQDHPSRIVTAIKIGKITRRIVWQNITIAMLVKVIVLIVVAGRVANLW